MDNTTTRFGSGRSVLRIEDDKLLKGEGRFTDDLTDDSSYADRTYLCFVRSPYPHARIVSIDKSAAQGMPGVSFPDGSGRSSRTILPRHCMHWSRLPSSTCR